MIHTDTVEDYKEEKYSDFIHFYDRDINQEFKWTVRILTVGDKTFTKFQLTSGRIRIIPSQDVLGIKVSPTNKEVVYNE